VLRDVRFVARLRQEPCTRRLRVGHGLLRGERLRRHGEQRRRRMQPLQLAREVHGIHVRDKVHARALTRVGRERLGHHGRPEIGAADADVHDVGDALIGVAGPGSATDGIAERAYVIERGPHVRHHVATLDHHGARRSVTQRDVQHGAAFGGVDGITGKHAIAPLLDAAFGSELAQQGERLVGDRVLGVVDVDPARLAGEAPCPVRSPANSSRKCTPASWSRCASSRRHVSLAVSDMRRILPVSDGGCRTRGTWRRHVTHLRHRTCGTRGTCELS
jgi:hypothetical protein